MLRSALLLALAALIAVCGAVDVWAAEADPVAVEAPGPSGGEAPAEPVPADEAEEEAAVAAAAALAPHWTSAALTEPVQLSVRTRVPPVPPPR